MEYAWIVSKQLFSRRTVTPLKNAFSLEQMLTLFVVVVVYLTFTDPLRIQPWSQDRRDQTKSNRKSEISRESRQKRTDKKVAGRGHRRDKIENTNKNVHSRNKLLIEATVGKYQSNSSCQKLKASKAFDHPHICGRRRGNCEESHKHHIQRSMEIENEQTENGRDGRTRLARPNSQAQTETGKKKLPC